MAAVMLEKVLSPGSATNQIPPDVILSLLFSDAAVTH